jgi:hypothetical protein
VPENEKKPLSGLRALSYIISTMSAAKPRLVLIELGGQILSGKALAALGAAAGDDLLAVHGRHAGTEAVAALADEGARLICAFHHGRLRKTYASGEPGTRPKVQHPTRINDDKRPKDINGHLDEGGA